MTAHPSPKNTGRTVHHENDPPSPQRRTYRVAHVGTGLTGREALRAIIDDPMLQLVGVLVSSPDKVGRDAGELCSLPATGVAATSDADVIVGRIRRSRTSTPRSSARVGACSYGVPERG